MKHILSFCLLLILSTGLQAQDSDLAIFTYGDDTVYQDEFMRVFQKNKRGDEAPTQAEIEEYLELYIKFKLKVSEAYARQMDTVPSFITELAGYRKQLSGPYMTDKDVNERLIQEAYDRLQEEVRASHLLIRCDKENDAEGCADALTRIQEIRAQLMDGSLSFEQAAERYSEDPSAAVNKGDLGYFTAFQMIYPFENAAYQGAVGSVSEPILTRFGYHLVQVNDRRPSLGEVQVGHIMIKYYNENDVDSAHRRAEAVYRQLLDGADWSSMVNTFSDDHSSVPNDGKINIFNRTTANIPTEFKDAAYELKEDGDISAPIRTRYGWHIIKRFEMRPKRSLDELREGIRRKVERDTRSELNRAVVLERIKKENQFTLHQQATATYAYFDSSLLTASWKYVPVQKKKTFGQKVKAFFGMSSTPGPLFTIGQEQYMTQDFLRYAEQHQVGGASSIQLAVDRLYNAYVDDRNFAYEDAHLEEKYPDFQHIMQEYKDGILLFELTDQEVWSKAIKDSAGLAEFYERNKDQYMWPERAEVTIYSFKPEVAEAATQMARSSIGAAVEEAFNTEDPLAVSTRTTYLTKDDELMKGLPWEPGFHMLGEQDGRVRCMRVKKLVAPEYKPMSSNLGQITSDYQDELEARWIASLRQKYPVQVFEDNVKQLY